jgi:hypothetical protein
MAEADGYPMGKRTLAAEENAARIDALAASLKMQDADDADDLKSALDGVANTEATLSVIDYMTQHGVDATIAEVFAARGETPISSCSEWEKGTIVLPASAVAPIKKALREYANRFQSDVLAEAKRLVRESGTTNPAKFVDWLAELSNSRRSKYDAKCSTYRNSFYKRNMPEDEVRESLVCNAAEMFLHSRYLGEYDYNLHKYVPIHKRVTVPTVADLAEKDIKKMTNRDDTFEVLDEHGESGSATITFNGNKVTWEVYEDNRAVDKAHGMPMAKVFFGELEKVKWTRGTGGTLAGNDEYARDTTEYRGGANYMTQRFGPSGEERRIWELMETGMSRKKAADLVRSKSAR